MGDVGRKRKLTKKAKRKHGKKGWLGGGRRAHSSRRSTGEVLEGLSLFRDLLSS